MIPHGALVALHQGKGMWPMFAFGFGAIFFLTQMYGLGWGRLRRRLAWVVYLVLLVGAYTWTERLGKLHEVLYIPITDYGLAALFLLVGVTLERVLGASSGASETVGDKTSEA